MWTLIKNNPWKTFFIALAATYVIVSLVRGQWNPLNWFSSDTSNQRARTGTTGVISGRCYCNGVPQGGNFTSAGCAAHCRDQMAS